MIHLPARRAVDERVEQFHLHGPRPAARHSTMNGGRVWTAASAPSRLQSVAGIKKKTHSTRSVPDFLTVSTNH
eukprot:3455384-Prymnesium_polylepis.1